MRIELVAAVISGVVAIGGAVIAFQAQTQVAAYQQDFDLLRLQLQQQHERQRPFLERQLQHYFEASEAASKVANLPATVLAALLGTACGCGRFRRRRRYGRLRERFALG
jgi:hypothetical protein